MAHLDRIDQVLNALLPARLAQKHARYNSRARHNLARATVDNVAQQCFLNNVARRLVGLAGGPGADRLIEPAPFPPVRVDPGQVARGLVSTPTQRLAYPVRGHEAAFAKGPPSSEEFQVLLIQRPRVDGAALVEVLVGRRLPYLVFIWVERVE